MIISFSGVDGAGKTTVLTLVSKLLKEDGYSVVHLRSRPSLFPILSALYLGKKRAEQKATTTLPRQGRNNSYISSFLRFFYYLADYTLGQIYVSLRYSRKNTIVIYDRFYFDFIADPRRSNLSETFNLPKRLSFLVWKPDINFLLYARPDEVVRRKAELNQNEIEILTENYRQLFSELAAKDPRNQYVCIENSYDESVIKEIRDTLSMQIKLS